MTVHRIKASATPSSGGAGTSTATGDTGTLIRGEIRAVYLEYLDAPPAATTDVTVQGKTTPKIPILTVTNAATDGWFYPMAQAVNQANVAIAGQGLAIAVDDIIQVTIAQANDADGVNATIVWDDLK